jgi:hypothetical protein
VCGGGSRVLRRSARPVNPDADGDKGKNHDKHPFCTIGMVDRLGERRVGVPRNREPERYA